MVINFNNGTLSEMLQQASQHQKTEKKGLFGKKEGGTTIGNTIRDKEKRENTVRDILDLGSLFGFTKSSTGQSREEMERQRQLELYQMREMQARSKQTRILGMPVWAFVLLLGFLILLIIVLVSKLKRN